MAATKDEAICLRLMDWSETSQIAVLMTESHGKVSAVAKGAKRQTPSTLAKFSGGIELLTSGEAVMILKRGSDLATLTEWDLREAQWHIRRSYAAYRLGMYGADLVHHIVQDHDSHPRTYQALRRFLAGLADTGAHQRVLLGFQWAVVEDMGLRPVLERDAETGEALGEEGETLGFSATAGGVVADTGRGDRWRVRRTTVRLLRELAEGRGIEGDAETVVRANRLLCVYFRAILDKQLLTMRVVLHGEAEVSS